MAVRRKGRSEDDLLAAVGAAPDADEPRLVFADWLSDKGDPRGELIQVQIELARTPALPEPRAKKLRSRERALLKKHRVAWSPKLPVRASWEFERGFPSTLRIEKSQLAKLLRKDFPLLAHAPTCQGFDIFDGGLTERADALQRLGAASFCKHLRVLRMEGVHFPPTPQSLQVFDADWSGLRELVLDRGADVDGSVSHAVAALRMPQLTHFSMTRMDIRGWSALTKASWFNQLETLNLSASHAKLTNFDKLRWPKLQHLNLHGNDVGNVACTALASGRAPKLKSLEVDSTGVTQRGAVALLHAPKLRHLDDLDLSWIALKGLVGLKRVQLPKLRALRMVHAELNHAGVVRLCNALSPGLSFMDLESNALDDRSADALASCAALSTLRDLDLTGNPKLRKKGWDLLTKSPHLEACTIVADAAGGKKRRRPGRKPRKR